MIFDRKQLYKAIVPPQKYIVFNLIILIDGFAKPKNPFEAYAETMTDDEARIIENIGNLVDEFEKGGFSFQKENNSIHSVSARKFFLTYCKSEIKVSEFLGQGYSLQLKRHVVPRYEEANNRSARDNMTFVREKIKDWESKGRLHKVKDKPACVNPLSVAMKYDPEKGETKRRLVLDCSRYVNDLVHDEPVKPNDLSYFESFFEKDGYMSTWDLSSMYHHMHLSENAKKYFGFMVPNEQTNEREYYVMDVLPFGFGPAMAVMNDVLNPLLNFVRQQGVKVGCFVDDGAIVAKNPYVAFEQAWFCRIVLQCAGWNLSWDKCQIIPDHVMVYQGFIIDQARSEYRLPEEKRGFLVQLAQEFLDHAKKGRLVQAKDMAGLLGKLIACRRSHGQVMSVALRYSQNLLGRAVMNRGPDFDPDWEVSVRLNNQAIREIEFAKNRLEVANGHPFPARKEFEVLNKTGEIFRAEEGLSQGYTDYQVIASDASDKIAFVYEAGHFRMVENFYFSEEESMISSGHRELLSILKTLESRRDYFQKSEKRIFWITDSQNVFYFMKRGSAKEDIQRDILRIKELESELGIYLTVIWAPRGTRTISWADAGSRMHKSTDEWSIDRKSYFKIIRSIGVEPTIDGFASRINTKCDRFFSKFPQLYADGVDFFAQTLSDREVYWLCPPPSKLAELLRHMDNQSIHLEAYISFPEWPSSNFWPMLIKGDRFVSEVAAVFYSRPTYVAHNWENSVFRGFRTFRFITVYMVWKGSKSSIPYKAS